VNEQTETITTAIEPTDPLDPLRKAVKHLMVDLSLDREGSYDLILPFLSERIGRPISKSTLCMALSSYRKGQSTQQLLEALQDLLMVWSRDLQGRNILPCEHIHCIHRENN